MNKIAKAKHEAGKRVLLRAVKASRWNLTSAGRRLGTSSSEVVRYLHALAPKEYRAARRAGLIQRGGDMTRRKQ